METAGRREGEGGCVVGQAGVMALVSGQACGTPACLFLQLYHRGIRARGHHQLQQNGGTIRRVGDEILREV